MVKCPRCGYENNSKSTYCVNCTYLLKNPNKKQSKQKSSSKKTFKKAAIILLIIVIILITFSLIYQIDSGADKPSSIVTSNSSGTKTSSTPYVYKVDYNGSWEIQSGKVGNIEAFSGSGSFEKRLDALAWDHILVKVTKTDSSTDPLRLIVYQNGKTIFDKSTTDSDGIIKFELNS